MDVHNVELAFSQGGPYPPSGPRKHRHPRNRAVRGNRYRTAGALVMDPRRIASTVRGYNGDPVAASNHLRGKPLHVVVYPTGVSPGVRGYDGYIHGTTTVR